MSPAILPEDSKTRALSSIELRRHLQDPAADQESYPWISAMRELQCRLPEEFESVISLSTSESPRDRELAADLLGQNLLAEKQRLPEVRQILLQMLNREQMPPVVKAIAFALGHVNGPECLVPLVNLSEHPSADVRLAAVSSLGGGADPRAIAAMIPRVSDEDCDVRNWATFGLGSLVEVDAPGIREALLSRLNDADLEIRDEALIGLARRRESRAVPALLRELQSLKARGGSTEQWEWFVSELEEALKLVPDPMESSDWAPVAKAISALRSEGGNRP